MRDRKPRWLEPPHFNRRDRSVHPEAVDISLLAHRGNYEHPIKVPYMDPLWDYLSPPDQNVELDRQTKQLREKIARSLTKAPNEEQSLLHLAALNRIDREELAKMLPEAVLPEGALIGKEQITLDMPLHLALRVLDNAVLKYVVDQQNELKR